LLLLVTVLLAVGGGIAYATIPPKGDTGPPGPGDDARRVLQLSADTAEISVPFGNLVIDCNSTEPFVEFAFFNESGGSLDVFTGNGTVRSTSTSSTRGATWSGTMTGLSDGRCSSTRGQTRPRSTSG